MEALYNVYRPHKFEDVCSQTSIISVLKRQIELNQFKNCYLFCGASGCGKTTIARILANEINKGVGNPIEIDAASNNGVENIREIVAKANERSLDSEYKIIIVDECFIGDTLISTPNGYTKIKDIKVGDDVYTLNGVNKVTNVFKKKTQSKLLKINLSNGESVVCTENHNILTTGGWLQAKNLMKGDCLIYDRREDLSNMSQTIPNKVDDLFKGMWQGSSMTSEKIKIQVQEGYTSNQELRDLWERIFNILQLENENLFQELLFSISFAETKGALCFRTRDGKKEIIFTKDERKKNFRRTKKDSFRENEEEQSIQRPFGSGKDEKDQRIKWDIASMKGEAWGKWTIYTTTVETLRNAFNRLGIRVSSEDQTSENTREPLSYLLQTRPCFTYNEDWGRGGWQFTQIEKEYIDRYEERKMSNYVRVESVEIYQRGSRQQHRNGIAEDTYVYDLTVENSPTYFANNVLVHNCHILTSQSWQAFLKCLEEPPKYTIFMFCTTDPQKIPATIINRVMRFNLTKIPTNQIRDRLRYICEQEHFTNYDEAIDYISKLANGGMRDAISFLDKASAYSTDLNINNVLNILGNFSYRMFFDITNAIIDGKDDIVISNVEEIFNQGNDLKLFIEQYLDFVLDLFKYSVFASLDLIKIPATFKDDIDYIVGDSSSKNYFSKFVDRVLEIKNTIKYDTNIKSTIEVMFIQMCRGV